MNLPSIAKQVLYLDSTDSTSNYIANLLKSEGLDYGLSVLTHNQTDGRGQRGNKWYCGKEKNIALSFYLNQKEIKLPNLFYLNKLCSLALQQVIASVLPSETVTIKWPNDVLVNEKKVAGILVENVFQGTSAQHICGIGLNANEMKFPDNLSKIATSLSQNKGSDVDLMSLEKKLFDELNYYHSLLQLGNYQKVDAAYHELLLGLNQQRTFIKNNEIFEAVVLGVNKDGLLRLQNINDKKELLVLEPKTVQWVLKP